jgi:hypothetical protein
MRYDHSLNGAASAPSPSQLAQGTTLYIFLITGLLSLFYLGSYFD